MSVDDALPVARVDAAATRAMAAQLVYVYPRSKTYAPHLAQRSTRSPQHAPPPFRVQVAWPRGNTRWPSAPRCRVCRAGHHAARVPVCHARKPCEHGSRLPRAATHLARAHPLLTFGSYRQGVHSPHSDIDALALVPDTISRDEFFHTFPLFLTHIAAVSQVRALPLAAVPVINLYMDGVAVDLLLARYTAAARAAARMQDVAIPAD
ncbi:hypothetical protein EON67_04720, partial [archaeon]